jgi:hypothetical protein
MVKLRASAWLGRPAPSTRANTVDPYFQGLDRQWTGQSMSDFAR